MKLNALDGSFLVKKILYYPNYQFTYLGSINFIGYAPNAQVLVTYMTDVNNYERIMFLNPNDLSIIASNMMH